MSCSSRCVVVRAAWPQALAAPPLPAANRAAALPASSPAPHPAQGEEARSARAAAAVEAALRGRLLDFLRLIGDDDRHVRKAAVLALSSVGGRQRGRVAGLGAPTIYVGACVELVRLGGAFAVARPDAAARRWS